MSPDGDPARESFRLDRRRVIQRFVGATGALWIAPEVLLTAPAHAAGTLAGTYRARFEGNLTRTDANGGGCVATNIWNATANFPATVTATNLPGSVRFDLATSGCRFDGPMATFASRARCTAPNNSCLAGALSNANQTITFTKTCTFNFYQLAIVCG